MRFANAFAKSHGVELENDYKGDKRITYLNHECRNSELAVHLRKCITLLSPSLRRTFQLRVVEGLSIFETAQALGLPHGTVKTQLARARRKLARYMQRVLESRSRKLSARTAQAAGGK